MSNFRGNKQGQFYIAEIGSNHNQDISKAKKLILYAKKCGFHAVKFQSLNFEEQYHLDGVNSNFHKWFKSIEFPYEWYEKLNNFCKKNNIFFFSSPTHLKALEKLLKINVFALKIASPQAFADKELVKEILDTKKRVIISLGYCEESDFERVISQIRASRNKRICLMHCVSNYPGKVETQNLNIIQRLKKYNFDVGYSDHTIGYQSAIIASSLGARVFEKHITIKRSSKGPDHFFASEINETKKYINMLNVTYKALGDQKFKLSKQVKKYRSDVTKVIGASKHIKKGEKLTRKNIEFKRSVFIGLNYDEFIKNKLIAKKDIKKNTTINKNMVINKK